MLFCNLTTSSCYYLIFTRQRTTQARTDSPEVAAWIGETSPDADLDLQKKLEAAVALRTLKGPLGAEDAPVATTPLNVVDLNTGTDPAPGATRRTTGGKKSSGTGAGRRVGHPGKCPCSWCYQFTIDVFYTFSNGNGGKNRNNVNSSNVK